MQKEILTPSNCKKDLAPQATEKFNPFLIAALSMLWLLCGVTGIFSFAMESGDGSGITMTVMLVVMGAVPLVLYITDVLTAPARAKKLAQKVALLEIEFIEDTLERAFEDVLHRSKRVEVFYVLSFQNFGRYRVPAQQHYAWSELYSMSPDGIYNTSIIGDTFYIAIRKGDPKKTPLWVYNAKLFELCPDGTERKPRASWRDSVSLE